jgi:Ca2+-transporting ATPase
MLSFVDHAWQVSVEDVEKQLQTNVREGLASKEVKRRLKVFGPNSLLIQKKESLLKLFFRQFASLLVLVLAVAGALAFVFEEWLEGIAIFVVILINVLIGFFMEWQAIRSMEALRKLTQIKANVFRNGNLQRVKAGNLVPGDLLFLEAGDIVPADARIVEQSNLNTQEAPLTGESTPVIKQTEPLDGALPLGDRKNLLFKGTTISKGNATAIITATGMATELGKISQLAHSATKASTPLEKKLTVLSKKLIWLTLILALLVLAIGLLQGRDVYLMIKTAIALAIAAIPEGLPIVATIALARGMLRMARHNVIVKKLSAVETLGETTIIFTDKTGTLTENRLSVDALIFEFEEASVFHNDKQLQFENTKDKQLEKTLAFKQLRKVGVLCNNAALNSGQVVGDPLEIALLQFSETSGANPKALRSEYPRLKEIPFDSDTKMMGSLHENGKLPGYLVCIKGAVEVILKESDFILTENGKRPLKNRQKWIKKADQLASKGLRVLAFAYNEINKPEEQFFHNLNFIGFIGFLDPPRMEVKEAIQTCKDAGIKVIMATGDHPETARTIAVKIGLIDNPKAPVIHGSQLCAPEQLKTEQLKAFFNTNIFSRVNPAQKLDLVSIYQKKHFTVGMIGDGINDAPALKKADIGIAMGQRGTEAAKEVADLVLEDDAFTSIVLAIKQGRGIFENIRHFVVYLLSCNLSEILIVAAAAVSNLGIPLLPLQILFLNMVTDVFPALALGMNKEAKNVMQQPPRDSREPIINRATWKSIIAYALGLTIAVFGVLIYAIYVLKASAIIANNLTFYTLILAQLWHVFNLPKINQSFFKNEITGNKHIWLAILTCILITVLAYEIDVVRDVLNLQSINWETLWVVIPFSFFPIIFVQFFKRLKIIV